MASTGLLIYLATVVMVLFVIGACIRIMFRDKKKKTTRQNINDQTRSTSSHHQDDVFSISSRVQGQDEQNSNRDAHLSIEHITTFNQLNKPNYDDAPPSYDEAMRIVAAAEAASRSNDTSELPTILVVPKTTN